MIELGKSLDIRLQLASRELQSFGRVFRASAKLQPARFAAASFFVRVLASADHQPDQQKGYD